MQGLYALICDRRNFVASILRSNPHLYFNCWLSSCSVINLIFLQLHRNRDSVSMSLQLTVAFLGEYHQEPGFHPRHAKVECSRLVFVSRGADFHGQLFVERVTTRQRLSVEQASLCQGHSKIQEMGREVISASNICNQFHSISLCVIPLLFLLTSEN